LVSLIPREEHRLRRVFEPERKEVTGGWRKLHNGELHNLYSSPNVIRLDIGGRVLKKLSVWMWTGFVWHTVGSSGRPFLLLLPSLSSSVIKTQPILTLHLCCLHSSALLYITMMRQPLPCIAVTVFPCSYLVYTL
jgi:hypothetical protein